MRALFMVCLFACGAPQPAPPSVVERATPVAPRRDPAKATLTGRVLLDGKPVRVFVVGMDMWARGHLVRAADGRFEIADLAPGTHDIVIAGPGFAARKLVSKELVADDVLDLGDVAVQHGFTVEGHVHDAAGRPVAGATVSIEQLYVPMLDRTSAWLWGHRTTTTDERGVYRFTDVVVLDHLYLVATLDERMVSETRYLKNEHAILDLVLHESGAIDASSEVIASVQISPVGRTTRARVVEARDGVFHHDNLVPGDYDVYAITEHGVAAPPEQRVTVVANQRATVTLRAPATPIRVTFTTSRPCREVELRSPRSWSRWRVAAQTCETGVAEIEGVTPGRYRACDHADCKPITVLPSPAQQTFDLR